MKAPKRMQVDRRSKTAHFFGLLACAEIDKRGGRVEIPRTALLALLNRAIAVRRAGTGLEFSLTPPDDKVRDSTTYQEQAIYRLEMLLKHLLATTPGQVLAYTKDTKPGHAYLSIGPSAAGGLVATTQKSPQAAGIRSSFVFRETEILKFEDFAANEPGPKH